MFLSRLTIQNLGPYTDQTFSFEPSLTVLTGGNDVGKSRLLDLVQIFLSRTKINEGDVNWDYLAKATPNWTTDPNISLTGEFTLTEHSRHHLHKLPPEAEGVRIKVRPQTGELTEQQTINSPGHHSPKILQLPAVLRISSESAVKSVLDLTALTPSEQAFMNVAFGQEFKFERLANLGDLPFESSFHDAEERLSEKFERILPPSLRLRFKFLSSFKGERNKLGIRLQDQHHGRTSLDMRGNGVRKIVSLLADLLVATQKVVHVVILLDEPETSLHADAQHLLLRFLEELTTTGRIQVIYATHSPCMINQLLPRSIRLLARRNRNEKAESYVEDGFSDANFLKVRSSLGMSPADSLLYAPITVVVEGKTEIYCLPELLLCLCTAHVPGFEHVRKVLNLCHFVDGEGDSFPYLCKLATSQGANVLVFLDGDKAKRLTTAKFEEQVPAGQRIVIPDGKEFEELIPLDEYFKAARDLYCEQIEDPDGQEMISSEVYTKWLATTPNVTKLAFTKRFASWFNVTIGPVPNKVAIMRRAIKDLSADKITTEPLLKLVKSMEAMVPSHMRV